MAKVFIEETTLTAIGDAIRDKEGSSELVPVNDMASRITSLPSGGGGNEPTAEELTFTGDCSNLFAGKHWDWIINKYGNQITTTNITNFSYMFEGTNLAQIPFTLNGDPNYNGITVSGLFDAAFSLKEIPKIQNIKVSNLSRIFSNCHNLKKLPEDLESYFIWDYFDTTASDQATMFQACKSLRSIPTGFLNHGYNKSTYSRTYFYYGFSDCYVIDELVDLPIPYINTMTSNMFVETFTQCNRLKNITFAPNDGVPYTVNWKKQTIDLTRNVGYVSENSTIRITGQNSGITADKEVKDDATYQALKNDPDWFTANINYSRYNHDSAVETINSLPDTSAYLATQSSSTNTIKFKGNAGSLTDGGAINTLTEEEIAVATAKGWTVSFAT